MTRADAACPPPGVDDSDGASVRQILEVEPVAEGVFRNRYGEGNGRRASGSQVLAQSFMAAAATVAPERVPHALHAVFLESARSEEAVQYEVAIDRDGGSFSQRCVTARQHGRTVMRADLSFKVPERGPEHQIALGRDVPAPEGLRNLFEIVPEHRDRFPNNASAFLRRANRFDPRPLQPERMFGARAGEPRMDFWIRALGELGDEPRVHYGAFVYLTDYMVTTPITVMHVDNWTDNRFMYTTLNHALWFHRSLRADDWLLLACESPALGNGRGLTRGDYYDRAGTLVASFAQEMLFRGRQV
ncbi:MAG: acyl-CoA thioesterase [Gammaproteobacteria bacterium]